MIEEDFSKTCNMISMKTDEFISIKQTTMLFILARLTFAHLKEFLVHQKEFFSK